MDVERVGDGIEEVKELADCGADCVRIEGRLKYHQDENSVLSLAVFALAKDDNTVLLLVTSSASSFVFLRRMSDLSRVFGFFVIAQIMPTYFWSR